MTQTVYNPGNYTDHKKWRPGIYADRTNTAVSMPNDGWLLWMNSFHCILPGSFGDHALKTILRYQTMKK